MESKHHFYEVAEVVPDYHKFFGESQPIPRESYPISDTDKPKFLLIDATKISDIIKPEKLRFSIILPMESGFYAANFIRREFGYEFYLSKHEVKRDNLKESIKQDTTTYFKLYAFTLSDLRAVGKLKSFYTHSQDDLDILKKSMQYIYSKNETILKNHLTFGIKIEGYEAYGIIESREIMIKSLLEMKYNPIINITYFEEAQKKYKSKR